MEIHFNIDYHPVSCEKSFLFQIEMKNHTQPHLCLSINEQKKRRKICMLAKTIFNV